MFYMIFCAGCLLIFDLMLLGRRDRDGDFSEIVFVLRSRIWFRIVKSFNPSTHDHSGV